MGDIKARLKRVKELIDAQEWKRAFEITDRICTEEPNHVQACLFMGKISMELGKPEKAIICFRIAIREQPEFLAAWQGIVAYHTRFGNPGEASEELLEGFKRCLDNIGTDDKFTPKLVELLRGYSQQLMLKGPSEETLPTLLRLEKLSAGFTFKDSRIFARKSIIRVLLPAKYETDPKLLPAEKLDLLLKTFADLLSEFDQSVQDEFYPQEHLNTLFKLDLMDQVEIIAKDYYERFETPFAIAALFMLTLRKSFVRGGFDKSLNTEWAFMDKLAAIDNQHALVRIGKAFRSYLERKFSTCADLMEKAVYGQKSITTLPPVYKLSVVDFIAQYAVKYLAISRICTGNQDTVSKAAGLLNDIKAKIQDWEVFFYLGFALVENGDVKEATAIVKEAELVFAADPNSMVVVRGVTAYMALLNQDFVTAENLSEAALRLMESDYLLHYICFRGFWDSSRRDPRRCISHLKRTLELFPDFADALAYQAFWTWREEKDLELAELQYEHAYTLQPTKIRIIRAITDFYTLNRMDDKAINVLKKTLDKNSIKFEDVKWMRLRLALICFRNQMWNECISYVRLSTSEVSNTRCMKEFLGDSLTFRGNYWSAKGVFEEVIELNRESFPEYSWYRRACIKQKLKLDQDAENDFLTLKDQSPSFRLMCLKNLAELEIRKASQAFENKLPINGIQSCQKAVDFVTEAVFAGDNSTLVWCLFGDACMLMRSVKTGNVELIVNSFIWSGINKEEQLALNVRQVLYLATICYGVAIELKRTSCRLWERLAMAYFCLAQRVQITGDEENCRKWMQRSVAAAKEMLRRSPYNPWIWNTAGIIAGSAASLCTNSDASRLHTKSLDLFTFFKFNPTITAGTWTALGYLYLNAKRFIPAHLVFQEAQSADPGLAEAWVGQAWCAENLGLQLEALDLFRHSCSLKLIDNAILRYAESVVWLLASKANAVESRLRKDIIFRLQSVPRAVDFLSQYIQLNGENLKVAMVLSVLYEWMGLKKSALDAAKRALAIAESSGDRFEGNGLETWNMAKINTARLLCEIGKYDEAIKLIETVESEPDFQSVLLVAVIHFHLGNHEEASNMLNIASESLAEDDLLSRKAVQLAQVAVGIYGADMSNSSEMTSEVLLDTDIPQTLILKAVILLSIVDPVELAKKIPSLFESIGFSLTHKKFIQSFGLIGFTSTLEKKGDSLLRQLSSLVHLYPERTDIRCLLAHYSRGVMDTKVTSKLFQITSEMIDWRLTFKNGRPSRFFSKSVLKFTEDSVSPSLVRLAQSTAHLFPENSDWHIFNR